MGLFIAPVQLFNGLSFIAYLYPVLSFQIKVFSEVSILVQFHETFLELNHKRVCSLDDFCSRNLSGLVINRVPAYDSLLLVCIGTSALLTVKHAIEGFLQQAETENFIKAPVSFEIPVCYDSRLGNDLESMAGYLGLSVNAIVDLHLSRSYHVFMIGFLPGFAYMGEVDNRIALPRKPKPVPTREGAVGIAGRQTGIYPFNSPGGWNIAGYTPLKMFDPQRQPPALIEPGQLVHFVSIDYHTYKTMHHREK